MNLGFLLPLIGPVAIFVGIVFLAALVICVLLIVFGELEFPARYRERACTGKQWKARFPHSKKETIRLFLSGFVDCMGFWSGARLLFDPEDKFSDVYRAKYAHATCFSVDDFEHVEFAIWLEEKFHVEPDRITELWEGDPTLGDFFELATAPA